MFVFLEHFWETDVKVGKRKIVKLLKYNFQQPIGSLQLNHQGSICIWTVPIGANQLKRCNLTLSFNLAIISK